MKKYTIFAFYLFIGDAFVRILNFFTNAYIARVLNTNGFGLITIGSSFLAYSLLLSDCGLKTLGFIETSTPQDKRHFTIADIFVTKILLAIIAFIALYITSYFLFEDKKLNTICLLFLLNVFYDALFLEWYFKGLQRFRAVSAAYIVSGLIYLIAVVLYIKNPSHASRVPLLFFVSNMISVLFLFLLLPSAPSKFTITFSISKYFALFKSSLVIGLSTLLNQVTVYLPPIILGIFVGIHDSGIFGAALKIVTLALIIDRVFSTLFLSTLPRIWNESKDSAEKYLQTVLHFIIATGFLVSLIVCISSDTIIRLIYGNKYSESNSVLTIICWFIVLTMINSIFAYGLLAIGQKKLYLKATATGFAVNIILILMLTVLYGKSGTCISLLIGELLFTVLCYHKFRKYCSLNLYIPFIKSFLITAAVCAAAFIAPVHPVVRCILAVPVFIILILLFNIVTKNDIALIIDKWKSQYKSAY